MPIVDDAWIKAFGELSLADRELCRRDILLYGNALIQRDKNGVAHRLEPVLPEADPPSIFDRPWWES